MALTVLSGLCSPGGGSTLLSLQQEQGWLLPPPADGSAESAAIRLSPMLWADGVVWQHILELMEKPLLLPEDFILWEESVA